MKKHNINPDEFYSKDDNIPGKLKQDTWNSIKSELAEEQKSWFQWRSFAFGFAAPVIILFMLIGVSTTYKFFTAEPKLPDMEVSEAYIRAAGQFEKVLPKIREKAREVSIDDRISARFEELDTLNVAISDLKYEITQNSYNKVKTNRLKDLYRMKLEIINRILELEENSNE